MSTKNQKISFDQQKMTVQLVPNEIEVSNSGRLICTLTGISIIPKQVRFEPLDIKKNLIRKSKGNLLDIQNDLFTGNYYVNILDYSLGEITYAANLLCDKWAESVWKFMISKPEKFQTKITLKPETIKKQLLNANPNLFTKIEDIDNFCKHYKISVEDFIVPAEFSQLEIHLEGVSARLSSEIFFFRKKLFTELLTGVTQRIV